MKLTRKHYIIGAVSIAFVSVGLYYLSNKGKNKSNTSNEVPNPSRTFKKFGIYNVDLITTNKKIDPSDTEAIKAKATELLSSLNTLAEQMKFYQPKKQNMIRQLKYKMETYKKDLSSLGYNVIARPDGLFELKS